MTPFGQALRQCVHGCRGSSALEEWIIGLRNHQNAQMRGRVVVARIISDSANGSVETGPI
jgi:hypothetical protein